MSRIVWRSLLTYEEAKAYRLICACMWRLGPLFTALDAATSRARRMFRKAPRA